MADNSNALAAMLMAQQGRLQQNQYDPAERSRAYAAALMKEGTSTAPVQSWGEGLARALQGGIGGVFAGMADREAKDKQRATTEGILSYANAKTPEERIAAQERLKDADPSFVIGLALQQMGQQNALDTARAGYSSLPTIGGGAPAAGAPGMGGGQPGPLTIDIKPLPAPTGQAAATNPNAQQAMSFLTSDKDLQLQPHQAAALVGRLYGESSLDPTARKEGDGRYGGPSVGISQWNEDRLAGLQKYAQANGLNPQDLQTQLGFMKTELLGPERNTLDTLRKAESVNAAAPVAVGYFRPKDVPAAVASTTNYGNFIYGQPDSNVAPQPGAPTPGPAPAVPPNAVAGPPTAAPQAATAQPQLPAISPQAIELQQQAQQAAKSGTVQGLTLAQELQKKAAEAQASWQAKRSEAEYKQATEQPKENVKVEHEIRQQFQGIQSVKDFQKAHNVFKAAVDASKVDTAAADLNMVYAFATLMDPGSVVRDSEGNMVINTQNASDKVKALVASVTGGSRLSPEARANLVNEMAGRYQSYKDQHDALAEGYKGIAKRSGVNPENIMIDLPKIDYERPKVPLMSERGQQQPAGAPEPTATGPNGEKLILRNNQWVPLQ